jgi:hypothetical protein
MAKSRMELRGGFKLLVPCFQLNNPRIKLVNNTFVYNIYVYMIFIES